MFFSVVIPVYNVEPWLRRAVDSVLKQTYLGQFEIILVDDGSSDKSGAICDEYADLNPQVKVIHKENGGLSSARNAGLAMATGLYIVFLDSDDWLESDALMTFYSILSKCPVDILRFTFRLVYPNGKEVKLPLPLFPVSKQIPINDVLMNGDLGQPVCDIVWVRRLIESESVKFVEGIFHEDELFVAQLECKAKDVLFLDYAGYNYFIREGSTTQSKSMLHLQKRMRDMCVVCESLLDMRREYMEHDDLIRAESLYRRACWRNFVLFRNLLWEPFSNSFRREIIRRMRRNNLYPLPKWTFQDGYAFYRLFSILNFPIAFFLFIKWMIQVRGRINAKIRGGNNGRANTTR